MFPHLAILKQAYEIVRRRYFLWVWGLFLGGTTILNLSGAAMKRLPVWRWEKIAAAYTAWLARQDPETASWLLLAALAVPLVLIVIFGLSKGAVIWSAGELAKKTADRPQQPTLRTSFAAGKKFLWPVAGLQILTTIVLVLLLLIFAFPIYYLTTAGAAAQATILLLLALVIMLPTIVIFGFIHLFGPIFIVLYGRGINQALALSFGLLRHKMKDSLVLAAFLIGLEILFFLALAFSLLVAALPVAALLLLLAWLKLFAAFWTVGIGAFVAAVIYVIVLKAGFAAFANITWVLALGEMIGTIKSEEPEPALARQPAASTE